MNKEEFLKSRTFKIMLPIVVIAMAIALWRNGYQFGQWLYILVH